MFNRFFHAAYGAGRSEEAGRILRRVLDETSPTDQDTFRLVALAYAGVGEEEKAIDAARRAIPLSGELVLRQIEAEIVLAIIQARLGEEAALASLPHLLEVPYGLTIADLKFDPAWDSLRDDPRFQKLLTMPEHVGP